MVGFVKILLERREPANCMLYQNRNKYSHILSRRGWDEFVLIRASLQYNYHKIMTTANFHPKPPPAVERILSIDNEELEEAGKERVK
jgi:hypothetical protein